MFTLSTVSVLYVCRTRSVDDGLVVLVISRMVPVRSIFSQVVTVPGRSMFSQVDPLPQGRPMTCRHMLSSVVRKRALLASPRAARVDNVPAGEIVMSTETVAL